MSYSLLVHTSNIMYVFSTVTANYVPPPANFDGEEGGKPPHPTTAAVKRKPKVKGSAPQSL